MGISGGFYPDIPGILIRFSWGCSRDFRVWIYSSEVYFASTSMLRLADLAPRWVLKVRVEGNMALYVRAWFVGIGS